MLQVTAAVAVVALMAACAANVPPPPVPTTPKYPEFMYPTVPPAMRSTMGATRVEIGWRYLQNDDLRSADREFSAALKVVPKLYPAHAGTGYVALARRDYEDAVAAFDAALREDAKYLPALAGRGQALLALNRDAEALSAFEEALAVDPSLTDVRRRIDVLRLRVAQEVIEQARTAAAAGRLEDARATYQRALESSPDSAFLHRELGIVERRRGDAEAALGHFQRAVELDPADAASMIEIGGLLEQRLDYEGAEAMYRKAAAIEPSDEVSRRIEAVLEKAREAKLPGEFHAIGQSPAITRGELAALLGVRFEDLLRNARPRQVVITDVRTHWAADWITLVAQAGVMEPFPNHTFQPRALVRRVDLAAAVSQVVALIASEKPELKARLTEARPTIADVGPGHLNYPAVATAVASEVMPLLEGDRFQVSRPVAGVEAIDTITRLLALAERNLHCCSLVLGAPAWANPPNRKLHHGEA
jgi:tetratricopeptide (TPR) repeat protein